jgi:sugar phosphate permease
MNESPQSRRTGRYRYLVIATLWLALLVNGFDRGNLSLLLTDQIFLEDLGLVGDPARQGLLMSALLFPYALSNIIFSPAADRWGPRRVLALMMAMWTAMALFMGLAWSYLALLVARSLRGVAEGPVFPVANRYVRYWFPPSERGAANAIWTSGLRIGLAVSVPLFAAVIALFGWRSSFFLQAFVVGGLALPAIWFVTADTPEKMPRVRIEERQHIAGEQVDALASQSHWRPDLHALLVNRDYWLAVLYHFALLSVYFGLVTWLPKYLQEARGFDLALMVIFASLPHVATTASSLAVGFISDRLGHRALICTASLAGASAAIVLAALAPDPMVSAVMMVIGFGVWGMGSPGYFAVMQRIIPGRIMATGIGIDNGISNFGSALAPTLVGVLIATTDSYLAGLLLLAGIGAAGALAAVALVLRGY